MQMAARFFFFVSSLSSIRFFFSVYYIARGQFVWFHSRHTHTAPINHVEFCVQLKPIDVSSTGNVANSEKREHIWCVSRNKIGVKCRDRDPLVFIRFQYSHRYFSSFFVFVCPLCRCIACWQHMQRLAADAVQSLKSFSMQCHKQFEHTKYHRCMRIAAVYFNFFSSSSHSNRWVFVSLRNLFNGEKRYKQQ